MGKFKRTYNTLNGTHKPKAKIVDRGESSFTKKDVPPETPQQRFKRLRACALIMAHRFGVKDWHRNYLTLEEIDAITEERREVL